MKNTNLDKLGFGNWLQDTEVDSFQNDLSPFRIIEVNKNSFIVSDGILEIPAQLSGKFLFNAEETINLPTVGDWVLLETLDNHTHAIIHTILPRKTLLKRKTSGKRIDFQLIAANIDFGLILQSAKNIKFNLIDRYCVMLHESKIQPIVVISKVDLLMSSESVEVENTLSKMTYPYILISNISEGGIENFKNILISGMTYCLLGQSGVGKSSLLNNLLTAEVLTVGSVRKKDEKGRHTTVRRQLLCLESGSIFIDTPGIRELGNFGVNQGIELTFEDISSYAINCRFKDCTHTQESGCAIIEAVEKGEIEPERYRNFIKLKKESEYFEMSYMEKRQKDKSFGKMIKSIKKFKGIR